MRISIGSLLMAAVLASGNAVAVTRTYSLPDTLTIKGVQGGVYTYGVTGELVDHALDGRTITIHSVQVTAQSEQLGSRINFDWQVWVGGAPLGLTVGGAQTVPEYGVIPTLTTPAHYGLGWSFVIGNIPVSSGPLALSGSFDFPTMEGTASPAYLYSSIAQSSPIAVEDGLYLQVSAWSGDSDEAEVDFAMSNIQVTIDYSIDGEPEPHPAHTTVPMLSPWVLALLAVSMGVMAMRRRG